MNVLLIEDNHTDSRIIETSLEPFDVNLTIKEDGKSAIEYLKENLPTFIILDLNIPYLTGKEVLNYVKGSKKLKHIPVIVYTTSHDERDINDIYDMGGAAYITKPFSLSEAQEKIKILGDFWIGIVTWLNR